MIITDGSLRTMEKQKVQTGIVWITTGNIIAARFLSPPPGPLESPGGGGDGSSQVRRSGFWSDLPGKRTGSRGNPSDLGRVHT